MTAVQTAFRFSYDPFSLVVQEDPYPYYRTLRDEFPVYHNQERGFFAISRYADLQAASRDWRSFSNRRGVELDEVTDVYPDTFGPGIVINYDPQEHDRIRKVVHGAFTVRALRAFEQVIRGHVRNLFAELRREPVADLAGGFAWRLPVRTISSILGYREEDRDRIQHWMFELEARSPATDLAVMPQSARQAAQQLADYIRELAAERKAHPRDDLLSVMGQAERQGDLKADETHGLAFILTLAGVDTTACLLSNTFFRLEPRPEDRAWLAADPRVIPGAVEEMLRFESPVQGLARVAAADVTLHDVTIPEGSWVWLIHAAANRDDRQFAQPDVLNVRATPPPRHLAFGDGIHHCIGAALARLEGRVALEEFFATFRDYSIVGPGERLHQHTTRGWVHLNAELR
jgi:cytochrome P450